MLKTTSCIFDDNLISSKTSITPMLIKKSNAYKNKCAFLKIKQQEKNRIKQKIKYVSKTDIEIPSINEKGKPSIYKTNELTKPIKEFNKPPNQ